MEKLDIYDLFYRDIMLSNNKTSKPETALSEDINNKISLILDDILNIQAKEGQEIRFSDVICGIFPTIDKETNTLMNSYIPIILDKNIICDAKEYIKRYTRFNINNLPFLDVARQLNVKIEKSNQLEVYGKYIHSERKIILGSDYVLTFIHELTHAIDRFLPNTNNDTFFSELTAELSAIILCKLYNISIDIPYSISYLNSYSNFDINVNDLINRVSEIIEFVKKSKEK